MKAFITLILAILCSTSIALADTYTGTTGDCTYTLDTSDSTLVISGTGAMANYSSFSSVPWYSYRSYVKTVTIEDGVASIGDYAFYGCYNLTSVTFGELETDFYTDLTGGDQKKWVPLDGDYGIGQTVGPMTYCNPDDVLNDGTYVTDLAFENWAPNWDPGFQSWLISETDPYMDSYMIFSLTDCTIEEYRGEDGEKGSSTGTTLSGTYTFNIDDEEHPTLSFTDTYSMHCINFDDVCDNYTSEIKVVELTEYVLQLATMRTNDEGSWWLVWNFIPEDLALGLIEVPTPFCYIGSYAFYGCTSLTSITIPNGVTSISSYTFDGCTSLTSVTIGSGVTSIGSSAFYNCTSLTSVTIPKSVTSIGDYAFYGCTNLTSVTIGSGVTSIGSSAFYNCTSLTSVTIPKNVTSIGDYAFYGCTSLTSVKIGSGVTSIGSYAFYNCTSLTSIMSFATTPPSCGSNVFSTSTYSDASLFGNSTAYLTADTWENFMSISYYDNAISSTTASTSAIRAIGNTIVITTEVAQTAQVYSLAGQLVVKQAVSAGETSIGMPAGGVYVVALNDGTRAKVLVK